MKGKKQQSVNLDRLKANNSLDKSNEQLRSSLTQETTSPPRTHRKIGILLGSVALSLLAFGWLQLGDRNSSVSPCWQSQIRVVEDASV
ncbi:hypothetical protein IQ235_04980 [Oscillatoriales cyanobacterium LEGE 11467]|uniref:Uncharacterized protein n=1 Tax=Zarconia navalis LEGE 11467 TaxID=1828826 RepID=A0A928VYN4_9CYAN|nr:hypothetical protein [Zarconia navalis]MBE9040145.1 hypothetical protein [Zarconia navalis LEGE 11467]